MESGGRILKVPQGISGGKSRISFKGFSQIFILMMHWSSSRSFADTGHVPAGLKLLAERSVKLLKHRKSASAPSSIIHSVTLSKNKH